MKRLMYLRSGPYEPDISGYNMQEMGMLEEFCKRGYDCDLFYYGKKTRTEVIESKGNDGRLTINFIKGVRLLRSGIYPELLNKAFLKQYDVIITSEYSQIMTVLISSLHSNVYCYNGPYYNLFKLPFIEPIYDLLFSKRTNMNIKSFFCKSQLAERYLNKKNISNTLTIGVGQNYKKFELNTLISKKTTDLIEFMDQNPTLLVVGTIDERKNFPFILEVFSGVIKNNPDLRLVMIGSGDQKYIKKKLRGYPKEVVNKISFFGKINNTELQFVYPKCFAYLMPSKLEIFGMVLLEAMSFGAVAISSPNGGSNTLIKDGVNGYIREIKDPKQWVGLISSSEFKINRVEIRKKAKLSIRDNFSWFSVAEKMIEEIEKNG